MLKTFIEMDNWAAPATVHEVSSANPNDLKIPLTDVVRFRFFQQTVTIINGEELRSEKKNFSNWYYVGKRLNASGVKSLYPASRELLSKMKKANCDAVLIRDETLLLLSPGDTVFNTN